MKFLFSLLLFGLFGCTSTPSENSKIIHQEKLNSTFVNLIVQTNLGADVDLEFLVYYRGNHDFNDAVNGKNRHLHKALKDSLRQFTVYEMYVFKRRSIDSITRSIVENEFKNSPIKIERLELGMIEIPKKDKERFWRHDESKTQNFKALNEVHDNYLLLKQKLETDKSLSQTERIAIEKEMSILDKNMDSIQKKGRELILE
ncbi:MAG: hypothetical protein ACJAUD_001369 [Crocinitomicaceae bacterium]|jgi:hypothetical protein